MHPRRLLLLLPLLLAQAVSAAERPVLVELYTSQGCSSCPPADAHLKQLAARDDVLALALHVDYWDYIGWKDKFADPAHAARQRAYAKAAGKRMVYTPQMIVEGQQRVVGNRAKDLEALIARHKAVPRAVDLQLARRGSTLTVKAAPLDRVEGPLSVQLVRYTPERTVEIHRGENAGRRISYVNIVTDWTELARWDGAAPLRLQVAVRGDDPLAVIIQRTGPGPVVAAAALE